MRLSSEFPTLQVVEANGGGVVGIINRTEQGGERWVADGCVGALWAEDTVGFGRWYKRDDSWEFKFDVEEFVDLAVDDEVFILDGYWGERVELVRDKRISWKQESFRSEGNRDHDHCMICWNTIDDLSPGHWTSSVGRPVCEHCYERHVSKKDISFVPSA